MKLTRSTWGKSKDGALQVVQARGRIVVYSGMNDLILFITGSEMVDEFGVEEMVTTLWRVFDESVGQKVRLDRHSVEKCFAKICVAIDEFVDFGQVSSFSVPHIMAQTKLKKPVKVKQPL